MAPVVATPEPAQAVLAAPVLDAPVAAPVIAPVSAALPQNIF